MTKLIHPLSGTLQNLTIFQNKSDKIIDTQTSLCTLLYNSSSLKELFVDLKNPSPLALLETNTCLTHITINCFWTKEHAESIASILQENTTLHCLILFFFCQNQIELLKIITRNIEANTTLQRLEFQAVDARHVCILRELPQLNDPRIHYEDYTSHIVKRGQCI